LSRTEPSVDLRWCQSHVIIKAILADGTPLRLGSATLENIPEPDAIEYSYVAKIVKDSEVRISTTRTADQMTFSAENVDKELGLTLNNVNTVLIGAKVTCCKVFSTLENVPEEERIWENKVLLTGEISSVDATQEEVTIKIISDTAPNVAFIATRPVQEKCPLVFKGIACGYVGPLTTCNKILQSDDGCSGRNNVHRYGGIVLKGELNHVISGGLDTEIERRGRVREQGTFPGVGGGVGRVIVPFDEII
jgi:hypothetical protein